MNRAVIYARYSSDNQDDATIETQLRECQAKAKTISAVVMHEYCDIAQSGRSTDDRQQFRQMLQDAKQRGFNIVIVRKYDRFARNVVDARLTEQHLEKYGVRLVSCHESFDDSTTAGWFSKQMVHLVNEWYSRNLAVETISGMVTNASKGFRCGGNAPYGYQNTKTLDKSTGKVRTRLESEPREAEAVRIIFERFAGGVSLGEIIKELAEKAYRPRKAKTWSKSMISQMLRNETYTGIVIWRKTPDPITWVKATDAAPAIVSDEIWQKVQDRIDLNPSKSIKGKGSAHPLTGLVTCACCGKNYVIKSKQAGKWRLYCAGHMRQECDNARSIFETDLIENVRKVLLKEIFTDENLIKALEQLKREMGTSNSDLYKQADQLSRQISEVEEKQIALVEEFASGNMPKTIVQRAVEKAEAEKAGLLKRREDLLQEIKRAEGLKVTSRDVCEFASIARCSIEDAEGLALKNMLNRFGVTVSISRNSAKIKVSPAVFADDTDTFGAGDGRLKISVSCLARNIQFAQSKRIYRNHHSGHKAR